MDFETEKELKLNEQIFDAQFHPNNQNDLIAAATIAGNVHLIEGGEVKLKIRKHHKGSSIRKIRFANDGRMLTIAKTVKVHDLESNDTLMTLKRNDDKKTSFYSLAAFGDSVICAGDDDGGIFAWDHRARQEPIFSSSDCEQYISDIDGRYEAKKLIICTCGEGTLTAYDMRNLKMVEPQSELFETGFQCVKWADNRKVVVGGEDGAIYIFNQNEWAHTSGKFALSDDTHNRGKCSIDALDGIPNSSVFLAACSDGKVRSFTLWPHKILGEQAMCKKRPLESIHVNNNHDKSQFVVSGDEYLAIVNYVEKESDENDQMDDQPEGSSSDSSNDDTRGANAHDAPETQNKKAKRDQDDEMPQADMESSSLIMKVIKRLTDNKDDAERDRDKKELENVLKASDQKLTKLVANNHKELRLVMQTFTSTSKNLQSSITKLSRAKQRLVDSRDMLTSRLEELKRLSEESKRNEKILEILDQIPRDRDQDQGPQAFSDDQGPEKTPEVPDLEVIKDKTEITPTRPYLFKFSLSSHAICFNEHYKEKNNRNY